jgi:flagellar hook-associated protein 3 FlgL
MRVTEGSTANNILSSLQTGQQQIDRLQQQASSGLKINAPGDDPVAAQQVLQLKGVLQDYEQYSRNITTGNAWLGQAESAMAGMGDVVIRAREIAETMASGTYSASDRTNAAAEVKLLKNELIQLGNSQVAGKYIFGGFVSDKPPFAAATGGYSGSDDSVAMEVGQGAYVTINYSGGKLLSGSAGVDVFGELDKLATALAANDVNGIRGTLTPLGNAQQQILAARTDIGGRMNRVQSASENLDTLKVSQSKVISDKQDVDILQVMSDLSKQQNAFQVALAAAAKTSQLSLLDYLR